MASKREQLTIAADAILNACGQATVRNIVHKTSDG
jgi:hypothetical protein